MKRLLAIFAALSLLFTLTACGAEDSSAASASAAGSFSAFSSADAGNSPFVFTRGNFPRLDGSTSTVPLGQAIASVLLGESREDVSDLTRFSKTSQSYRNLVDGAADLLISAAPPDSVMDELNSSGFAYQMDSFATDALVFLVNQSNPVDSLTADQVRDIYTGKITNWSQVGGDDVGIVPFQRNAGAGSQGAMERLVMGGQPMMEAPADYVRGEMGDLVQAVAAYDDTASAIGYTVYYYAHDMKMADGLKLLAIGGVEPDDTTIRDGSYPFLNPYYVVVAANLPPDSPAAILRSWLLSKEGQRLVAQEGYVSVTDAGG